MIAFTKTLLNMKECLEDYIGKRYGLKIFVKEPKELALEPQNKGIQVSKWQIRIITHPERRDIPSQMIKVEVANITAYTNISKNLITNYDFLPDGYSNTLVLVESLEEIFVDKIIAFISCETYIRHRDIWDIYWLIKKNIPVNIELVKNKISDYKITKFLEKRDYTLQKLHEIIFSEAFKTQLSRFLTKDVIEATLEKINSEMR